MSLADIKKQVEYYLSDQNLAQDELFHKTLTENGTLKIDLILKCNKIKKLNATQESIKEAIKDSTEVEVHDDSIKRKNNKPLPQLIQSQKKKPEQLQEQKPNIDNPYHNFDPLIFTVQAPEGVTVTWSQITEALMKQHNISAPYVRYGKTEGNFALSKPRTPQENIDRLRQEGIKLGETQLQITVTDGDKLKEFWAHHGKHFEGIIKRAKEAFATGGVGKGGSKKDKKFQQQQKEIIFHNQKYRDISQLKNIFKTILGRSQDGVALKEPYHSMIVSLLNYHDKKEQKLNNLKHFTVGQHPEHKDTRCFIAVKEDGTQEDFSCLKCIKNLEASLA